MNQPHLEARAGSGAAAQGHLAVAGDNLLMPTGRAVPAVFNLRDGKFRYFQLQDNHASGGSEVAAFDAYFVNSGCLFAADTGRLSANSGRNRAGRTPRSSTASRKSVPWPSIRSGSSAHRESRAGPRP